MPDTKVQIITDELRQNCLVCVRLKKFDPDNDDESLSNLEAQCDVKEEMQPLHGSCLPADSIENMESGMFTKCCFSWLSFLQLTNCFSPLQSNRMSTTSCSVIWATAASWTWWCAIWKRLVGSSWRSGLAGWALWCWRSIRPGGSIAAVFPTLCCGTAATNTSG